MKLKRWETVLKYIVEDYIATCEPIGSKTLLSKHRLPYSSATIRNDMAFLEKQEYIDKPHTSGGRVPTVYGYRYYVSNLRSEKIDKTVKYEVDQIIDSSTSIDDLLVDSCKTLANMTNLAVCYVGPNIFNEEIVHLQLIKLYDRRFMILFVTDKGFSESKNFIISNNLSIDNLNKVIEELNEEIKGVKLVEVLGKFNDLKTKFSNYETEYHFILKIILLMFKDFMYKHHTDFFGRDYLLNQMEFKDDPNKIRTLLKLMNEPYRFNQIFEGGDSTLIAIGSSGYSDITIIEKDINPKIDIGKIIVIGPIRMDYDKVLKYLDYVTKMISNHLLDLERSEYGRK